MDTAQRIDFLVKALAFDNAKLFAEKVGVPPTSVSKWRHGARNPSYGMLERILAAYPEVRPEWLHDGKGMPMARRGTGRVDVGLADLQRRLGELERKMDEMIAMMREIAGDSN